MLSTLPQGNYRFIALDVETGCGDAASICQIGIACVGYDEQIETFATYVDPRMAFSGFNIQLHGIGPETVRGAPVFEEAMSAMLPLLERHHLVQHSSFDARAISKACEAFGFPVPLLSWTDSVRVARKAWPEFKGNGGHGLGHLKVALDLDFEHHDAGEDARAAAQVVMQAEERLQQDFDDIREALLPKAKRRVV
ncbi:exonuclease [Lentibacter algarum]|uniref:exonuclease domain-containing protein n=1 Tax=Lentibacter algarum TaxID=576131 RepID=UPI001C07EF98|nr:exonuclease domain-containing protein [Lentibacter algarum]MBU2983172.1 exonuclease [Lentibacter algarum]